MLEWLQRLAYSTLLCTASVQYVLYFGAEANLAVALYGLSVQVSCLMVYTCT